jgi:hypothetical protein
MFVNGSRADAQPAGDLAPVVSLAEQVKHLDFAVA